jgi:hypothetical protein
MAALAKIVTDDLAEFHSTQRNPKPAINFF